MNDRRPLTVVNSRRFSQLAARSTRRFSSLRVKLRYVMKMLSLSLSERVTADPRLVALRADAAFRVRGSNDFPFSSR